jgi:hypothetical protein
VPPYVVPVDPTNPWTIDESLSVDECLYRCERVLIGALCVCRMTHASFKHVYCAPHESSTATSSAYKERGLFAQLGARPRKDRAVFVPDESYVFECLHRCADALMALTRCYEVVAHMMTTASSSKQTVVDRLILMSRRIQTNVCEVAIGWKLCVNALGFVNIRKLEHIQEQRTHHRHSHAAAHTNTHANTSEAAIINPSNGIYYDVSSQASAGDDTSFVLMLTCDGPLTHTQGGGAHAVDDSVNDNTHNSQPQDHWVAGSSSAVIPIISAVCNHVFTLLSRYGTTHAHTAGATNTTSTHAAPKGLWSVCLESPLFGPLGRVRADMLESVWWLLHELSGFNVEPQPADSRCLLTHSPRLRRIAGVDDATRPTATHTDTQTDTHTNTHTDTHTDTH